MESALVICFMMQLTNTVSSLVLLFCRNTCPVKKHKFVVIFPVLQQVYRLTTLEPAPTMPLLKHQHRNVMPSLKPTLQLIHQLITRSLTQLIHLRIRLRMGMMTTMAVAEKEEKEAKEAKEKEERKEATEMMMMGTCAMA